MTVIGLAWYLRLAMALTTIRAVSYDAMRAWLSGEDPLGRCAAAASSHDRVWIISITGSPECPHNAFEGWGEGGPAPLVTDGDDRIALVFDDVEPRPDSATREGFVCFDPAMAARVVEFVLRAHGDSDARRDALLINCHAGVSRSGAVADFARVVADVSYDSFRRENPQAVPNAWVRRLLLDAWNTRLGTDTPVR